VTVLVGSWEFEGPFTSLDELRCEPGIYAIFASVNDEYELMEMDEAESVREWLHTHDRYFFGNHSSLVKFSVAVYYCADLTPGLRQGLIDELIQEYQELPDSHQLFHNSPISPMSDATVCSAAAL